MNRTTKTIAIAFGCLSAVLAAYLIKPHRAESKAPATKGDSPKMPSARPKDPAEWTYRSLADQNSPDSSIKLAVLGEDGNPLTDVKVNLFRIVGEGEPGDSFQYSSATGGKVKLGNTLSLRMDGQESMVLPLSAKEPSRLSDPVPEWMFADSEYLWSYSSKENGGILSKEGRFKTPALGRQKAEFIRGLSVADIDKGPPRHSLTRMTTPWWHDVKQKSEASFLPAMLDQARSLGTVESHAIIEGAMALMLAEIARLKDLAEVYDHIKPEEITALEERESELASVIGNARVRLDVVWLIWKAPPGQA